MGQESEETSEGEINFPVTVIVGNKFVINLSLTFAIWKIHVNFLFYSSRNTDEVAAGVFCDNPPLSFHGSDAIHLTKTQQ